MPWNVLGTIILLGQEGGCLGERMHWFARVGNAGLACADAPARNIENKTESDRLPDDRHDHGIRVR